MKGALPIVAACVALAIVAAAGAVSNRRQRELELSPLPSVENGGPRGLAAARAWLAATGRPHRVLRSAGEPVAPGEVLLLIAPQTQLAERDAAALLAHAERGALVVWAMGDRAQPALEQLLDVRRATAPSDFGGHAASSLAPHPLFEGLSLRTGGASLRSSNHAALPVAGVGDLVAALSIPRGAGEVVVLAGPDTLENFRLAEGGNLGLLSRLAAAGPLLFDERHLAAAPGAPESRASLLLAGQVLLVAAVLLLALGRRLGSVRVAVEAQAGLTARDYLASLADLYRRTGDERELRASAWRSLRRALERRGGIPARSSDDEAARRLALRSPEAADAFARGRAALHAPSGEAGLVLLVRASAETEAAMARRLPGVRARIR